MHYAIEPRDCELFVHGLNMQVVFVGAGFSVISSSFSMMHVLGVFVVTVSDLFDPLTLAHFVHSSSTLRWYVRWSGGSSLT